MIDENLLAQFGSKLASFDKGEVLFNQGDMPRYYFQILSGAIKMNNFNDEGKEFVQGLFSEGDSFGEPPLFLKDTYPANAVAIVCSKVFLLPKDKFMELLMANPEIHLNVTTNLAKRLYYKSIMASEISSQEPEHRVLKLMDYFKTKIDKVPPGSKYKVEITRQQIADLTGLRVETVIRSIKSLEKKGELVISNRKVYL
ncbi:cAMP-activated global transcriptional regulator CRP [compost metagenome]|uniref:Crp/Fnr family transcriptional regulator n=1 Tax=Pedobacter sp. ok626 TaxID=1761882 RepID=UPI000889EE01|nr:Crp/Fnr family transcriptional regulator [Pedobacter sp. ok626]SDI99525.1 cAMP-binding domain of CRP or a regulatory subunit of cAMP-dependent protein kinases [Pedobacter sp. ok626]